MNAETLNKLAGRGLFGGFLIIENSSLLVGPFEDWSQVRSPGRARRRRKQGHPQRIRYYHLPDPKLVKLPGGTIVGHPATVAELKRALASQETTHG